MPERKWIIEESVSFELEKGAQEGERGRGGRKGMKLTLKVPRACC